MLGVSKNPCTMVQRPVLWGRDVRRWKRKEDHRASPGPLFSQEWLTLNKSLSQTHTHTHRGVGPCPFEWTTTSPHLTYPWSSTFPPSAPRNPEARPNSLPWGPSWRSWSQLCPSPTSLSSISLQNERLSSVHSLSQRGHLSIETKLPVSTGVSILFTPTHYLAL